MREILFQVCAAAVLTAVVKALVPSERYEKQFRLLISCFFIAVVLKAFGSFSSLPALTEIFDSEIPYNDYSVQVSEQTAEEIAGQLRTRLREELEKKNIFPEKIYVGVNILNENNISISEIRLVFKNAAEDEKQRAVSAVKKLVGNQAEVTAEDG